MSSTAQTADASESRAGGGARPRYWAGLAASALSALVLALWLFDAALGDPPRLVLQIAVLAALSSGLVWLALLAADLWRRGGRMASPERAVLLLLALSLVVHLVGIQWELLDHPRNDEGVFYEEGRRVNAGQLLPQTFNYGHFLYYASAVVLWLQDLFPGPVGFAVEAVFGITDGYASSLILLRALTALLGALTAVPIFWAAYRIGAGQEKDREALALAAGTFGGLLITLSTVYNTVAHEIISDVPSGFFAALCLAFVARLLDGESVRDYLLAGLAAGLAAASKYPGGVVAVAIFGIWLYWRIRTRSWSWDLLWAALASIAALLAVMPAMGLNWQEAFRGEGKDVLFGWRQYAKSGWMGVMPGGVAGTASWYGKRLLWDFGPPAILLGLGGISGLLMDPRRRRVVAMTMAMAMAIFPVTYLALIVSMRMVVLRNLQPVLPALAMLLGVGCAVAASWAAKRLGSPNRPARAVIAAVALLVLCWPAARVFAWDVSRSRPGTRQQMRDWMEANLAEGSGILQEDYTPKLERRRFQWVHGRFLPRIPAEIQYAPEWDYALLADASYKRFLSPDGWTEDWHQLIAARYREIMDFELAAEFRPGWFRAGPRLALYRLQPEGARYRSRRRWQPNEVAWVSDDAILPKGGGEPITFTRRWQIAAFKDSFKPGLYEVKLLSEPPQPEAYVHLVTPDNRDAGSYRATPNLVVDLEWKAKYLVRVFQAPGTSLQGVILRPAAEGTEASPRLATR